MMKVGLGLVAASPLVYLMVRGFESYPGSEWAFAIFSAAFSLLLVSGFWWFASYTYTFLAVFLWLGFWLKGTLLLVTGKEPYEPIGQFASSAAEWDEVLLISVVAMLGVLLARALWAAVSGLSRKSYGDVPAGPPVWYPSARRWLWAGLWVAIGVSLIANELFGLLRSGHLPLTIVPWPLQGLYGWLVSVGFPIGIAALVWWDYRSGHSSRLGVLSVLGEAVVVSFSTLSRGVFVLHTLPYMGLGLRYPEAMRRRGWRWCVTVVSVGLVLLAASIAVANYQRYFGSSALPVTTPQGEQVELRDVIEYVPWLRQNVRRLAIDRWPGLEGLMAVVSYPEKGLELLLRGVKERRVANKADLFTAEISGSGFTDADTLKHQYATVPGPVAFFYYSGSLWLVAGAILALVVLLMAVERFVGWWTGNPVIVAVFGVYAAFLTVQLGNGVVQATTTLAFTLGVIGAVGLAQRLGSASEFGLYGPSEILFARDEVADTALDSGAGSRNSRRTFPGLEERADAELKLSLRRSPSTRSHRNSGQTSV